MCIKHSGSPRQHRVTCLPMYLNVACNSNVLCIGKARKAGGSETRGVRAPDGIHRCIHLSIYNLPSMFLPLTLICAHEEMYGIALCTTSLAETYVHLYGRKDKRCFCPLHAIADKGCFLSLVLLPNMAHEPTSQAKKAVILMQM